MTKGHETPEPNEEGGPSERRVALSLPAHARLEAGEAIVVPLGDRFRTVERMLFDSVVVVREPGGGPEDRTLAFANACPHQATPLDARAPDPDPDLRSPDGHSLVCHSHGALFRLPGGTCISGPCLGGALACVAARVVRTPAGAEVVLSLPPPLPRARRMV